MIAADMRVDMVLTDPPYLIDYQTHRRQDKGHKFCKPIQGDNDPQLIIDLMPLLYDVMKDDTPLYMFCGSDKVDFFKGASRTVLYRQKPYYMGQGQPYGGRPRGAIRQALRNHYLRQQRARTV